MERKRVMKTSLEWKTLKRTTILKDEWIDLEASECQLPNGKVIAPFYVNRSRDFVVIVAITKEKELLVERQYRHGVEKVLLEIPAGGVEPGEDAETAAHRELMEETGYRAHRMDLLFKVAPNASSNSNYAWCYLARDIEPLGCQNLDDTEALEIDVLPLLHMKEMLRAGMFEQAVHVAALYRALDLLERDGDI